MNEDKRRHARVVASLETIYYTEHGDEDAERLHYFGMITNVSDGGVGMVVNCPHDIGEELWLEGVGRTSGPQAARVRWIADYQDRYTIGVQFRANA